LSDLFWDAAAPLLGEGVLEEGTIMGSGCVRAAGEFVAMPHHMGPGIVVKLPRERVDELIESGEGASFKITFPAELLEAKGVKVSA